METNELLEILVQAGKLKQAKRHCFVEKDWQESVADHSYRVALMAFLLKNNFTDVDTSKVIEMCLIHDLGESFTGDIPTFEKKQEDGKKESQLMVDWISTFSEPTRSQWLALWQEMEAQESLEAKLYKALDKCEAIISHNETDLSTWLDLEYDLQYSYGKKEVAFSDFLVQLHAAIDAWTTQKIQQGKEKTLDN